MVIRDRHLRHQKLMLELSDTKAPPTAAGGNINDLFYGARDKLQETQKMLFDLLQMLQNQHVAVKAAPVANVLKLVTDGVEGMNELAENWKKDAQRAKEQMAKQQVQVAGLIRHGDVFKESVTPGIDDIRKHSTFQFDKFIPQVEDE